MNFLINYWYIIVAIVIVIIAIILYIYFFIPNGKKISKIKEWLLYAVTEAEKKFGSNTGQIKLSYVYELFMDHFPWIAKLTSFSFFSNLVDQVLEKFKNILTSNTALQAYVNKSEEKE